MLADPKNLTYAKDRRRRDAYEIGGFPEALIETYVEWYSVKRSGYEGDRFLMEHKDFYDTMVKLGIWKRRDLRRKPPTEPGEPKRKPPTKSEKEAAIEEAKRDIKRLREELK